MEMIIPFIVALFVILIGIFQILGGLSGSGVLMCISAFFILYLRNMVIKIKEKQDGR